MSITSTDPDTLYPWGDSDSEFDSKNITGKDKLWFARQVNEKISSVANLSRRFNIKYRTVYEWAHRVRMGKTLQIGAGRPRVLDRKSLRAMKRYVADNRQVGYFDLGVKLDQEYIKSLRRRPNYVNNSDDSDEEQTVMLTDISFNRYLAHFKRMTWQLEVEEDDLSVGPITP